ncbi:MAG: glycoside hydrolase family 99-like domain-containing protein [Pseudomonadota bacterium]
MNSESQTSAEHLTATSVPSRPHDVKLIAMYFPQLHAIPENDEWWGKGFTDWNNVRSAVPMYEGHYQPRVPLDENYYDQSRLETLRRQIDLAKRYGVHGFCHYHYWFDGKQLLETPTNLVMANKDIDFPFCLSWANETWTKRWDARDHHILIQQTHPPARESWKKHYDYLIKAWTDPRAIKVDGKPVFVIYRPQRIEKIDEMLAYWRELAQQDGLPGLYFIFQKQYELANRNCLNSFDALFQFQPFEAINSPAFDKKSIKHTLLFKLVRSLPERYQNMLRGVREAFIKELTFHDYNAIWQKITEIHPDQNLTTYPGAFVDWDNTARYKKRATIFRGASPEAFGRGLARLVDTMPQRNLPENFIFLNAWNEWSECAYLEPDERYGHQYLEVVKRVLER